MDLAKAIGAAKRFTYRASDDKLVSTESGYVTDPASPTLYVYARSDVTYDARRNSVRESASDGGPVHTLVDKSWDDAGRLVCTAQRMNPAAFGEQPGACAFTSQSGAGPDRITHNVYDNAGQLLQVQKAYGVTTANGFPATLQQNYATYDYTWNGRQKAVTDANGNRAEMTYDGYDRQRRWIFPSATTPGLANASDYEEYGYDAAGNRTSLRKRDTTTIVYQYDGANRLRTKIVPASATGAPGCTIWYGYDVRGLTLYARFATDTGAGVSNVYDGFGRLTSSASTMGGVSRTVGSDFDAAGNRIRVTHPDGTYFTYDYDAAAAPTLIRENGGTGLLSFQYDGVGRRVVAGSPWWATSYAYDPAWRLQSLEHNLAGTSGDEVLTFGYNAASQVVTRTSSNDAYAATEAQNVARGYAVNGLNQYTSVAGSAFSYDLNGNLTSDGSMSLVYDGENRLVAAAGSRTASLVYDPLGRLWQVSGGSGTTQFLYDGDARIAEYDGAGNLLSRYVHGADGAADDPLVWYDVAGGSPRRSLFADQQGSIVAVADQYDTPLKINAYDEWGVPNAGNLGRFGYTGQTWIPELQMWYYKARFYSAKLVA